MKQCIVKITDGPIGSEYAGQLITMPDMTPADDRRLSVIPLFNAGVTVGCLYIGFMDVAPWATSVFINGDWP